MVRQYGVLACIALFILFIGTSTAAIAFDTGGSTGGGQGCGSCKNDVLAEDFGGSGGATTGDGCGGCEIIPRTDPKFAIATQVQKDLASKTGDDLLILESLDPKAACASLNDGCAALSPAVFTALIKKTLETKTAWENHLWELAIGI